jgi:hypothetical protein
MTSGLIAAPCRKFPARVAARNRVLTSLSKTPGRRGYETGGYLPKGRRSSGKPFCRWEVAQTTWTLTSLVIQIIAGLAGGYVAAALVAPVPQWRQNYPNNQTHRPETMTAEMGQEPHLALQKGLGDLRLQARHAALTR